MPITNELFTMGTTSSTNSGYTSLFSTFFENNRSEILILNTDLIDAAFEANDIIKGIGFYVTEIPDRDLKNVKIGIKYTSKTSNPSGVFEVYSTFEEVFSQPVIARTSLAIGWVSLNLSKDFIWNGNDNILVTLIRDDNVYGNVGKWQMRALSSVERYRGYGADGAAVVSPMDNKSGTLRSPTFGVPSMKITVADRGGSGVPIVTNIITNRTKISDEAGVNQSVITVRFDVAVTQYVARLNGSDYNTGTLVHTGGAVAANTDAQVVIDWNELTTEGSNRINVYGQNASGWTVLT